MIVWGKTGNRHYVEGCLAGHGDGDGVEYVQAVTDCEYIAISKHALDELSMTIVGWDMIVGKITAKGMADKVNRISPMMADDAKERYLRFLTNFPTLANRIPLSYLASYLGITQSSLSRIRRNMRE